MKTNNINDYSARTANQVNSILKANGISNKAENLGNNRDFSINDTSIKTRAAIKKAGFILGISKPTDKTLYFRAF